MRLYDERSGGRARAWAEGLAAAPRRRPRVPLWSWSLALGAIAISLVTTCAQVMDSLNKQQPITITAHRGASRLAFENSLAAIRKAIELGADFAEIDVHLTADGVPVLVHDDDLKRLAGDPRRVADLTLDLIRTLDVGSSFDRAFAGERIATLEEAINLSRGKISLNIELKPTGADREKLARAVADLIRHERFETGCFVTSLDLKSVELAHDHNQALRTGAIISVAVGDVTRLNVNVLSVRSGLVNEVLLDRARTAGREVQVWTIDDRAEMAHFIDEGVDGIITNDPATAIAIRAERLRLPAWQRLALSVRSRLVRH